MTDQTFKMGQQVRRSWGDQIYTVNTTVFSSAGQEYTVVESNDGRLFSLRADTLVRHEWEPTVGDRVQEKEFQIHARIIHLFAGFNDDPAAVIQFIDGSADVVAVSDLELLA